MGRRLMWFRPIQVVPGSMQWPLPMAFFGRMPADGDPALPGFDQQWPIELQRLDGGAANGCEPDHQRAVFFPAKMLLPNLGARVEQGRYGPAERVASLGLNALAFIAWPTGGPQVVTGMAPAGGDGDKVVEGEGDAGEDFGR